MTTDRCSGGDRSAADSTLCLRPACPTRLGREANSASRSAQTTRARYSRSERSQFQRP